LRQRWTPIGDLRPTRGSFWLALEAMESPGNLGTVLRTAEAAGVSGTFLIDRDADPYDPAAVRSTMGALFSQRLVRSSGREFAAWARARGVAIVGSSPAGLLDYKEFRCPWPAVLVIGSEKHGMSDALAETCDFMLRIPMWGRGDSINVAVATGILLYEMLHQRWHNRE
jgi:TrmH family RNA methyltransferase